MAQLPPKIPNMTPNWPDFSHHQKLPPPPPPPTSTTTTTTAAEAAQTPSWIDEFLDFSSVRRGTHRRSMSDSITFLEAPPLFIQECRNNNNNPAGTTGHDGFNDGGDDQFDGFDDEQFMSMFNHEMPPVVGPTLSTSDHSTPSDHNSNNDDKKYDHQNHQHQDNQQQQPKKESEEVQSSCESDTQLPPTQAEAAAMYSEDRISDPKRVKRILANRQSAQRSRVRKLQYISELERSVTTLQAEVSVLSPRVAFLDHQRLLLNVDNSTLKQRIAALAQDKLFKDAHQEALKREIERLRQVYHQQSIMKTENKPSSPPLPPSSSDIHGSTTKEEHLISV